MTNLKQRMKEGQQVTGIMVTTFTHPDIPRLLQNCGYDFFIIDMEHGAFSMPQTATMVNVARAIGMPVLVRIPELRREVCLKVMEMGANGILLPNTETKEQAELLVKYTKYAPMGERGVSLSRPHTGYQKVNAKEYMAQSNADNIIMCQMESEKGIANVKEILSVEGVDVAFIGPNDLSQDMGILGQFDNEKVLDAFEKVIAAADEAGKVCGVHFGKAKFLKPWMKRKMLMNMCNSDVGILCAGARADFEALAD